jgi:hypothetical protein
VKGKEHMVHSKGKELSFAGGQRLDILSGQGKDKLTSYFLGNAMIKLNF